MTTEPGYLDATYCDYYEDCVKAPRCHRPLTPKVKAQLNAMGEDHPPVFNHQPDCHQTAEELTKELYGNETAKDS